MSDDPVAVIYSASLNGGQSFPPGAQMEVRAPSPDQVHGLEGLVCGQVRKVPVPTGSWKITANILMPNFRWDKSVLERGVRSENAYNLPPGPNNPVGIVWMALNRPSVGMHGTPTPDRIGRNESHGCIRMANWDAYVLSQLIGKGTPVEVK